MTQPLGQQRRDRNRKRSKRRQIYCPDHGCYLDSVSRKYLLYTDSPEHLRQRGVGRRVALILIATETAVRLDNEWIEGFGARNVKPCPGTMCV